VGQGGQLNSNPRINYYIRNVLVTLGTWSKFASFVLFFFFFFGGV
jgi:hypothetical protein